MKSKTCSQHELCSSSDSQLAICKCWCAECKEIMAEIRQAIKEGKTWPLMFGLVR